MTSVVPLFESGADPRCEALLLALEATLYERGTGLPVPSALGVIEILKARVMQMQAAQL